MLCFLTNFLCFFFFFFFFSHVVLEIQTGDKGCVLTKDREKNENNLGEIGKISILIRIMWLKSVHIVSVEDDIKFVIRK